METICQTRKVQDENFVASRLPETWSIIHDKIVKRTRIECHKGKTWLKPVSHYHALTRQKCKQCNDRNSALNLSLLSPLFGVGNWRLHPLRHALQLSNVAMSSNGHRRPGSLCARQSHLSSRVHGSQWAAMAAGMLVDGVVGIAVLSVWGAEEEGAGQVRTAKGKLTLLLRHTASSCRRVAVRSEWKFARGVKLVRVPMGF